MRGGFRKSARDIPLRSLVWGFAVLLSALATIYFVSNDYAQLALYSGIVMFGFVIVAFAKMEKSDQFKQMFSLR